MFNYALNDGLLLLEFKNTVRKSDGPRTLQCWKVLLMYFQYTGNNKIHPIEAFRLLADVISASASPRVAH